MISVPCLSRPPFRSPTSARRAEEVRERCAVLEGLLQQQTDARRRAEARAAEAERQNQQFAVTNNAMLQVSGDGGVCGL